MLVLCLRVLVDGYCVEHGSAEWAVPIAEVVIILTFFDPFDFIRVAADLAFMHGFAPLYGKEKGDSVIESPFDGLR
jgi:hypothetical protein